MHCSHMKKKYQQPSTVLYQVETSILCASGTPKSVSGLLQPIVKGNNGW